MQSMIEINNIKSLASFFGGVMPELNDEIQRHIIDQLNQNMSDDSLNYVNMKMSYYHRLHHDKLTRVH